jgi:N-acetylneuraminic acid mutarotase
MRVPTIPTINCLLLTPFLLMAESWETLPPLPEANGGFAGAAFANRLVIAGGTNWVNEEKRWLDRIHIFDPATRTWSTADPLPMAAAYGVAGAWNHALWITGGSNGQGAHDHLLCWNAETQTTSKLALPAGCGAVLAAGGIHENTLLLVGGVPDPAQIAKAHTRVYRLHLDNASVERLPDLPGPGRFTAAGVVAANQLFVFGGAERIDDSVRNRDDVHALDLRHPVAWRKLPPLPAAVRGLAAAALDGRHLYLAGGYHSDAFTSEAWIYDLQTDRYTPAPPLPFAAMTTLVRHGDHLYCLGGEDRQRARSTACYRIPVRSLLPGN